MRGLVLLAALPALLAAARIANKVCNNGTDFACFCADVEEHKKGLYPSCYGLIQGGNLSVIRLRATELVLDELLPPKEEEYESYFKRRLAKVVSRHCAAAADRCPGLGIDVQPQSVLILKVRCVEDNQTELLFTILRERDSDVLNATTAMSATVLLDVMKENRDTLNRVFGPATITELRILTLSFQDATPYWRRVWEQNRGIIIALIATAAFLVFVYVIAVAKLIRDRCCAGGGGGRAVKEEEEGLRAVTARAKRQDGAFGRESKDEEVGLRAVTAKAKRQDGAFRKESNGSGGAAKRPSYGATTTTAATPLRRPSELLTRDSIDGMAVRPPSSSASNRSLKSSRSFTSSRSSSKVSPSSPPQIITEVALEEMPGAESVVVRRSAPPPPQPRIQPMESPVLPLPPYPVSEEQLPDLSSPPSTPPSIPEEEPYIADEDLPPPIPDEEPYIPDDDSLPPPTPEEEPYIASDDVPSVNVIDSSGSNQEQLDLNLVVKPTEENGDTSVYEETSDSDTEGAGYRALSASGSINSAVVLEELERPAPSPAYPFPSGVQIRVVSPVESARSELSAQSDAESPAPPKALQTSQERLVKSEDEVHSSEDEARPLGTDGYPTPVVLNGSSADDFGSSEEEDETDQDGPGFVNLDYHRLHDSTSSLPSAEHIAPLKSPPADAAANGHPPVPATSDRDADSSSPDLR